MKNRSYYNLVYLIIVIAGIFYISSHYIIYKQKNFGATLINQITVQENNTYTLADSVRRSKLTPELSSFVRDCSIKSRNKFDNNLDKLSTLTPIQLEDLDVLFDACGNYFINVKAALLWQLDSEIKKLEMLNTLANELDQNNVLRSPIALWYDYYSLEKKLAEDLKEQLDIQIKIVALLKEGKSSSDSDVQSLVASAKELSIRASATTKERDTVFAKLEK